MALLASAGTAHAQSTDATDDAFGALLAMPGAQPKEGGWIVVQEAAKDETDLIARLRELKKAGADINAMRHGGTLLAHAIRAGKDRTALWLLRNGADTRKLLLKDDENADDLARRYQRAAVVKVLEGRYGLRPTPAVVPARQSVTPPLAASAAAPGTRLEQSIALMARLEPLARRESKVSAEAGREWQRWSAMLSPREFASIFQDGDRFDTLVILTRNTDTGLQEALDRLPDELVRRHAQAIADALARWTFVTYAEQPRIAYTNAARAWPALWRRLDRPLRYDVERAQDLAGDLPPEQWPALFASGYANHEAEDTGCLLAMVDGPRLQALWPGFQRYFADARDAAAGLVLAGYRIDRWRQPCPYGSAPPETAAKLAFLRAQGVTGPVYGLRPGKPDEMEPALAAMLKAFTPTSTPKPRLVATAPTCELAAGPGWLDALVKAGPVGWGVTPSSVQFVDLPGRRDCGLLVGGDSYPESASVNDDFDDGPSRDPVPRCADLPDDGEIWMLDGDAVHRVKSDTPARGTGIRLRKVRDLETGKDYLFDTGQGGATCNVFHGLPSAFEWRLAAASPTLVPSPDVDLLDRLLRRQCVRGGEDADVSCPGIDETDPTDPPPGSTLVRLGEGRTVALRELVDVLGIDRRAAYRAALVAHDHAALRRLVALGIPPWWTAAEIQAVGPADLPLAEKRRRVALLFADPGQLARALNVDGPEAANSLGPWLPRADWAPILRLIRKSPADWYDARQRFAAPDGSAVGCDLDHAHGFLCGDGLRPD